MRIRTGIATLAAMATIAGCSTAAPDVEETDTVVQTPIGAVDRAQNVADQVEQRQADLEAQLNNPFQQP